MLLEPGQQMDLTSFEIDQRFGICVRQVMDFQYLRGSVFKDYLNDMLSMPPDLRGFKGLSNQEQFRLAQHETVVGDEMLTSKDRILRGWHDLFQGTVLSSYREKNNPLPQIIKEIRVDYRYGGYFCIKRVQCSFK